MLKRRLQEDGVPFDNSDDEDNPIDDPERNCSTTGRFRRQNAWLPPLPPGPVWHYPAPRFLYARDSRAEQFWGHKERTTNTNLRVSN